MTQEQRYNGAETSWKAGKGVNLGRWCPHTRLAPQKSRHGASKHDAEETRTLHMRFSFLSMHQTQYIESSAADMA